MSDVDNTTPKKPKGNRNPFGAAAPKAIRQAALQRVMKGESPTAVAKSIGMAPSTVVRWCKVEGVTKGSALKPDVGRLAGTPDHLLAPFEKHLKNQQIDEALNLFIEMSNGMEDKYRKLVVNRMFVQMNNMLANPPATRTWGDIEKAHRIMSSMLGIDGKSNVGSGANRLEIQLDVVGAEPKKVKVVEAEEIKTVAPSE